jgi:uncharacterized protein
VNPDLKAIVEVQQFDREVAELTVLIDSLPKQAKALQSQLDNFINTHEERKKRLTANLKERKDLEGDIKATQDKITRHRDQLYQVKTNEQYKALLHEIEGEEGSIRKIEDKILEKMVESEEIQSHVQEAAARLDGEKARVAGEIKKLEDEQKRKSDEREGVLARRKELAAGVTESVLELYDRIRAKRPWPAVAEVRNGLCTACNIQLRPQVYNEVRTSEAIMVCENCNRIQCYAGPPAEDPALGGGDGTRVSMS